MSWNILPRMILVALLGICFPRSPAAGADPEFIAQADTILKCVHPNGAIVMDVQAYPDDSSASPLWIVPYHSTYAALGLLNSYQQTGDGRYREAVRTYMEWQLDHLNPDGTIYDCTGTWDTVNVTGTYDSSDAYAAIFMVLLNKYDNLVNDLGWLQDRHDSIAKVADAIELTYDGTDGLTEATPTYPVKYLMDNVEVRLGYLAGHELATRLNGSAANFNRTHFESRLIAVESGLRSYWNDTAAAYSHAKLSNDSYDTYGADTWYPCGMANAMMLAYALSDADSLAVALADLVGTDFYDSAAPPADARDSHVLAAVFKKFGRDVEANQLVSLIAGDLTRPYTYCSHRGWYLILNSWTENSDLFSNSLTGVCSDPNYYAPLARSTALGSCYLVWDETATFDGRASSDSDGLSLAYSWSISPLAGVLCSDTALDTIAFSSSGTGLVYIVLSVSDGDTVSLADTLIVRVVRLAGDVVGSGGSMVPDGVIGIDDLQCLSGRYNASSGQAAYDAASDFNADGRIDAEDIFILAANYGG